MSLQTFSYASSGFIKNGAAWHWNASAKAQVTSTFSLS